MNRILTILLLSCLCCEAQLAPKLRGFRNLRIGGAFTVGTPDSHWTMDEAQLTTRVDSIDSRDLNESGLVTSVGGKIGNAAAGFDGTLLAFAGDAIGGDFDFSFSGWVWFDNIGAGETPMESYRVGSDDLFRLSSTGTYLKWGVSTNNTAITTEVTSGWNLTNSVWYFVCVGYDDQAGNIWISVNNEARVTTACPVAYNGAASAAFRFGIAAGGGYFQGRVDSFSYWLKTLSTSDINYLWNGGIGRGPPF